MMHKLSHMVGDMVVEHSHPPVFSSEPTSDGGERLRIGVPAGDAVVMQTLISCLQEPFYILYILHTPRGEGEPGRYQSPELGYTEIAKFIYGHAAFLSGDSRHDLWVYSPDSAGTLVWDRHNFMFGYGPLDCYRSKLLALGFNDAPVPSLERHLHHYRREFDDDAAGVLSAFDWQHTSLRPEDEQ